MCSNRKTIQNEAYGEKRMIKNERALLNYITTTNDFILWAMGILGSVGDRKNILRSWKKFSNISEKYKFTGPKSSMNPKYKYEENFSETHHNEIAQNQW